MLNTCPCSLSTKVPVAPANAADRPNTSISKLNGNTRPIAAIGLLRKLRAT